MYSPNSATALQYNQGRLYGAANNQQQNSRYSSDYYDYYDDTPNYNNRNLYNNQKQFKAQQNNALNPGLNRRMGGSYNMRTAASHGSYSDDYCDNGISIGLLLTAALGIAVMFYTLYTKITMAGGRRRRKRDEEEDIDTFKFGLEHIADFFYSGNNFVNYHGKIG